MRLRKSRVLDMYAELVKEAVAPQAVIGVWSGRIASQSEFKANTDTSTIGDFTSMSVLSFTREPFTLTFPHTTSLQRLIKALLQLQTGAFLTIYRSSPTTYLRRYVYPQGGN